MTVVFADTFYWISLANRNDSSHKKTADFARTYSGRLLTTEWVLTEVIDGLSSKRHRHLIQLLRALWKTDKKLTVVEATHDLFERGLSLFCNRQDKEWSLTDCISFVVMEEYGLSESLTGDHHFEQAGFATLLS